jgi:XTP/dITP diphosphohydrolase
MKKILVATNNAGKVERYRKLLRDTDIELVTPRELGIEPEDVEENGKTLAENAELKARAYFGKTHLPILANDTGFYVEGEGLVEAPKRLALGDRSEKEMNQQEIAEALLMFWKGIATKYGGEVDAAWPEAFVLVYPDGTSRMVESRREVLLTDKEFGPLHLTMPLRPLYISKMTGKPAIQHTLEEEDYELTPVRDALVSLLVS